MWALCLEGAALCCPHAHKTGCTGGVRGSSGARKWEEKSARAHAGMFEQVRAHAQHRGGTERPEPCSRRVVVDMGDLDECVWFLVVGVLRALAEGGGWGGGGAFPLAAHHITVRRTGERDVHTC
jgi:hypothetical protein